MANPPHAAALGILSSDLLQQMLKGHERFVRGEAGGQRASFKFVQLGRVNLSSRTLQDADFTAASLKGAQLIRANLQRAAFLGADLSLADLRAADCRRADFRGALLGGANLGGANLDEADLRRAVLAVYDTLKGIRYWRPGGPLGGPTTLRGSSLNSAVLDDAEAACADFSSCSLKNARLNGANLKGARFRDAVLSGAEFKGAVLAGVDLQGAVLTGVNLADLNLPPEALKGCVCDPDRDALDRRPILETTLEGSAAWVESNGRRGLPPVFDNEDVRVLGDAFRGRTLTALSMRGAIAVGMDFGGAELQGAVFDGADLRDCSFAGADLRGASFRHARLSFARFDRANLGRLDVDQSRLDTLFDGADLTGARFDPPASGGTASSAA